MGPCFAAMKGGGGPLTVSLGTARKAAPLGGSPVFEAPGPSGPWPRALEDVPRRPSLQGPAPGVFWVPTPTPTTRSENTEPPMWCRLTRLTAPLSAKLFLEH